VRPENRFRTPHLQERSKHGNFHPAFLRTTLQDDVNFHLWDIKGFSARVWVTV
jgi:hypothetical protein